MVRNEKTVQWGNIEDFNCKGNEKFFGIDFKNENGVFLGRCKGKNLVENSKTHILGITPKRSGQGISIVIPTLIEYWKESAFIFDLKGEYYYLTSGARKNNLDNMILKFAPFETESQCFNPFEEVRFLTDKEEKDVNVIAEALFSEIEDKKRLKNLDNLFKALVFQSFFEKSLSSVSISNEIKISDYITFDFLNEKLNDNLNTIFAENEEIPKTVETSVAQHWFEIYEERLSSKYWVAQKYFQTFCLSSEKEQKETIKELKNILNIFTNKNLKKNTQKSDFSVTDLVNHSKPVSLYYSIHMKDLKNDVIGGIMISQIIYRATEKIPDFDFFEENNYRCLFVMNDFAKIKKIPLYEEAMSYMMSYGMKSLILIESISDFKRKYNADDINYFLSNSQTQLFYGTNDINTINYVNSLLCTEGNEIGKLSNTKGILKVAGKRPLLVDKIVYFLENKLNELAKIPTIIPESLYDENKMYIKTENKELALKYIPNKVFFDIYREKLEKMEVYLNLITDKDKFSVLKSSYNRRFKQYEEYRNAYNKIFIPEIERYFKKNYSETEGLAGWMSLKELKEVSKTFTDNFKISSSFEEEGVVLGKFEEKILTEPLNNKGHIAFVAPSNDDKVIPTLLKTWEESVFVLDMKNENYQLTSGARKENFDNYILRFSLFSENSCKYNPFSEIRIMSSYEEKDIELIADIICEDIETETNNKYYIESAKRLLKSVIIYLIYKNFLKEPKYVFELGKKIPITTITIEDIEFFFKNIKKSLKEITKENMIEKYGKNKEIKEIVRNFLENNYKNYDNIELSEEINEGIHPIVLKYFLIFSKIPEQVFNTTLETLTKKISPFIVENVKKNMSKSDFRMVDLMNFDKPVSFYFHIPSNFLLTYEPLTRLFMEQMFSKLSPEIENNDQIKHKHKMLLLLDNFTSFKKMVSLEKAFGYIQNYGIKVLCTFPSINILNQTYGENNSVISNFNTQVFGISDDNTTAQYVSEICGRVQSREYSNGEVCYIGAPIITEEEFKKMPKNRLIIKCSNLNPIMAEKIKYYEEVLFKENIELPFTVSESLVDVSKQYFKLTQKQKEIYNKRFGYNFNYLPSKFAIIQFEKSLENMKKTIDKMTREYSMLDKNDIEKYNNLVRIYSKNLLELNNTKNTLNYFLETKEY